MPDTVLYYQYRHLRIGLRDAFSSRWFFATKALYLHALGEAAVQRTDGGGADIADIRPHGGAEMSLVQLA
jgi:hypothetical protein